MAIVIMVIVAMMLWSFFGNGDCCECFYDVAIARYMLLLLLQLSLPTAKIFIISLIIFMLLPNTKLT